MRLDLWKKLTDYCNSNLLWHYREESNLFETLHQESSEYFKQLVKIKLEEISSLASNSPSEKLNIIIAESHPINLLAVFLGGIISKVNIFLCDPNWHKQEWQQVLRLVEPDGVFAEPQIKKLISAIEADQINTLTLKPNLLQESLIMIPTGGTSGKVKFAMHNWSTLSASVAGFKKHFNCQKINSFCTLPLYHVSGLMQFIRSFITQGDFIICPYKAINEELLILKKQYYFISLVPTQLLLLIELAPSKLKEFKTVLLGGASISRSLLDEARKHDIPLAPTYGMTETASGVVTLKPEDFLAGNNSNGQVLPHVEVIVNSSANNPGLINIKCNSLCLGYYPHTFNESYVFSTDDLGYFDKKGYLYLVGRNSQKIITGGENVFPAEVEAAILDTKLVKDICIIGVDDRKWGQVVTAVYVPLQLEQNLDLIKEKIKLQLAKYKQPKNWIEVNSLPRNNRGKINYQKVRAIANKIINNR